MILYAIFVINNQGMLGSKITSIRLARGYTQEYVASKLGIAQNTYSKIERDENKKLPDEMIKKIADILGVSVEDITSHTPIIMNFNNSPQSGQYHQFNTDPALIEDLRKQLLVKDEQIKALNDTINALIHLKNKA